MKIRAKYPEYKIIPSKIPMRNLQSIGFEGNLPVKKSSSLDKIINNSFAQELFKLAQKNPHVFNLINLSIFGMALRPATVLAVPGAEKEDKQYVAAKSLIGTALIVVSELIVCIPLGKSIEKLGKAAETNPKILFPKINSPKYDAYNFFISHAVGLVLTLALSSFLTVRLTTKIMNKLFQQKNSNANKDMQKLQEKERGNL